MGDNLELVGLILGGVLCGGVALQLLLFIASSFRRTLGEGKARRLEIRLIEEEIDAARRKRAAAVEAEKAWEGFRKFEVARKVKEAPGVSSIYLVPHDKRPLPSFHPGQYLTFQLSIPGKDKPVIRCYSLSDSPGQDYYRCTIKKVAPPPDKPELPSGLSSTFFNEVVQEGDILDVKAPHGHFYMDMAKESPAVLIGGGIGITPVLSMLNTITRTGSKRETWFFLGLRDGAEMMFREHIEQVAAEHDNIKLQFCYSKPRKEDKQGKDYHHHSRVSVELFKKVLPSNNYDYYMCGPGPMMSSIVEDLEKWGVPTANIHYEAFGPASVKKVAAPAVEASPAAAAAAACEVTFAKASKTLGWTPASGSLLELAEANGIRIDSGCRAGNCGTCTTAIKSGKIKYPKDTGVQPEAGSCLVCIGMPDGPLVLDA
jgi:hypothetical protein